MSKTKCLFTMSTYDSQENEIKWELDFDYTPGSADTFSRSWGWQQGDPPEGEITEVRRNGDRFNGEVPQEVYDEFEKQYTRIGEETMKEEYDEYLAQRAAEAEDDFHDQWKGYYP